jgi:transcriptional regulator with XRE-family HTH domain
MPRKTTKYAEAPELERLGQAIRRARKDRGIAQEKLALDCEIERSYLGGIERGEVNFTYMKLVRIAKELDLSIAELVTRANT